MDLDLVRTLGQVSGASSSDPRCRMPGTSLPRLAVNRCTESSVTSLVESPASSRLIPFLPWEVCSVVWRSRWDSSLLHE